MGTLGTHTSRRREAAWRLRTFRRPHVASLFSMSTSLMVTAHVRAGGARAHCLAAAAVWCCAR